MKKSIIFIAVLALLTLGFTACEKESLDKTRITYYAAIELNGETTMVIQKGTEFKDPGFTATMKGADVTDKVKVASNVDTSTSGVYSVNYSIANEDGFVASAVRTVIVMDLADPVEGFWTSTPTSFRKSSSGAITEYGMECSVLIIGTGNGNYHVDDLIAGWYVQRIDYPAECAMVGDIHIDADGTITLISATVPYWGYKADYLNDGLFDADKKQITYKVSFAGMEFDVTLNKDEL